MLQLQFLSCPQLSAQTLNPNTKLFPSFSSLKSTQTHAFKFNPLSLTTKPSKFSLKCRQSDYFDQKQRFTDSSSTPSPPPPPSGKDKAAIFFWGGGVIYFYFQWFLKFWKYFVWQQGCRLGFMWVIQFTKGRLLLLWSRGLLSLCL